jgi:hypothetical protein
MLVPMTQPTLPAITAPARDRSTRRRRTPFALDERTKSIGLAGIARARAALERAAHEAAERQAA